MDEDTAQAIRNGGELPPGVTVASVDVHRWDVRITFVAGGQRLTMIASADSAYSEHDRVWWGTADEWSDWLD